jgi:hypothetical protein
MFSAWAGAFAQAPADAGFAGRVLATDGTPLQGVTIAYQRAPAVSIAPPPSRRVSLRPGERLYSGTVRTDAQGLFSVLKAPAGFYRYCVIAEGYLDPCRWQQTPEIRVTPGSTANLGGITLKKGVVLSIKLRDPAELMTAYRSRNPGISIGVLTPSGAYHPATLASEGAQEREFRITVPPDRQLDLWVHSLKYVIRDEVNSEVEARGKRFPFQANAGMATLSRGFTLHAQRGQP